MKKRYGILTKTSPDKYDENGWHYITEQIDVEIMAVSGIYAMVRRKGCMPFVCDFRNVVE